MTGSGLRRTLVIVVAALPAVVVLALAGVGWHYSTVILGPEAPPRRVGESVLAHTDSTITLAATLKALRPGHWALEWNGGHGKVGPIETQTGETVTRQFRLAAGAEPMGPARLGGFAFDADPRTWLGIDFDSVAVPTAEGTLASWLIPGTDSTWAVLVHGRGASRSELLRMIESYRKLGLPCLVITYRGDPGAPRGGDGRYRFGTTEWRELEAAVRFALDHGARDVLLAGCSTGGGIVAQFLRLSELRPGVRPVGSAAPAPDWNAGPARGGARRNIPPPLTQLGKRIAALRTGIRWDELTQVRYADAFTTPMLIFHGQSDQTVPPAVSDRFAAARPDLVTLVRVEGANHVESANVDEARYAEILMDWLAKRGIGSRALEDRTLVTSVAR